ncbi:MAG: YdcF family protein [Rhodospirillales bacterium]|nr:YdcF family protein [Rhodospirillales bacterium]
MILHALLVSLIVPPPNLTLVALAGLALRRRRPRLGGVLLGGGLAGLLLLSLPAVSQTLIRSLEIGLPLVPPAGVPPQAIVVLSAEIVHLRGPGARADVGRMTLERMRRGVELHRRTDLPILVTGGRLGGRRVTPVAVLMARSLQRDFGVQPRWVEPRSKTTWQNAAFSAAILRRAGVTSVYLVTNAWHERRALLAFRHFGLIATAAPVALDALTADPLPSTRAWRNSYFAFHEWIGLADYALRAWLAGPVAPAAPVAAANKPA